MSGIFNIFDMMDNYEERKVDRYEVGELIVDTASVTDSPQPYETAVSHKKYNDGKWVIVEQYDSKEESQVGHDRWVKIMTAKKLPKELKDVSTCGIAMLCESVSGSKWREHAAKKKKLVKSKK